MLLLASDSVLSATCPACQTAYPKKPALEQVRFQGAVTGIEAHCSACGTAFFQTLPGGQFNRFPVSVSLGGQRVSVAERGRWLVPLVRTCLADAPATGVELPISREVRAPITAGAAITLLICLDSCFGHALLMLFNSQRYHDQHPDRALIVVVPKALAWLVPNYVAEIWVVDVPLSALQQPLPGFDAFMHGQLARFGQVWFSTARIHFDHRTTRFADFTRTQKFDLNQFASTVPRLTFVLREDRLWLRHAPERWLYQLLNRLGLRQSTRPLWARWQAVRYRKLQDLLHQKGILADVVATGLTSGGHFPTDLGNAIHDDRHAGPISPEQERTWCVQYARSQLVVGVHGSGMLLPTSLAAGFICLLPPDKLPHYAEDILLAHDNPIHQTLLGRFLPTSASPRQVADMIASMLTEFPVWLTEEHERDTD